MTRALVLHSPLVGPSSVRRLAAALERHGWEATVPDLRRHLRSPAAFLAAAVAAASAVDVVIGHSGAGAFVPSIAAGATVAVFVDAVLPDEEPELRPSGRFVDLLATIPDDVGDLAPWHTWWPEEVMAALVPDDAARAEVTADIPRVPRSFYDEAVTLPTRWWTRPAAYLQLSAGYEDERRRAERWGWPTRHRRGQHLDLFTEPDDVAGLVVDLVAAAG